MITRQDYLNGNSTLDEYYLQFSTSGYQSFIAGLFSPEELMESNDHHFNDISLQRWDNAAEMGYPWMNHNAMKQAGEIWCIATGVCLAKSVARVLKSRNLES